jgi:acyl-CoA thioesterase-1
MNWLVYLFASGEVFFLGIGFILAGAASFSFGRRPFVQVLATLSVVFGIIAVSASSTPLPYWLYALAGSATLAWLVAERSEWTWLRGKRKLLRPVVAGICVVVAAMELPHHLTPALAPADRPTLYVVGDSISAGIGQREETWPRLLGREHSISVVDLSRVGAGVDSALRQAAALPPDDGLILLEIGGNDLLGSTTPPAFERGLDVLLKRVCTPGRVVVMFELPLPPFCNDYGLAQRRLAARYGVSLIPKRVLLAVLTGDDATLDSLHLTPAGHQRLADAVWAVIRPAFRQ